MLMEKVRAYILDDQGQRHANVGRGLAGDLQDLLADVVVGGIRVMTVKDGRIDFARDFRQSAPR